MPITTGEIRFKLKHCRAADRQKPEVAITANKCFGRAVTVILLQVNFE